MNKPISIHLSCEVANRLQLVQLYQIWTRIKISMGILPIFNLLMQLWLVPRLRYLLHAKLRLFITTLYVMCNTNKKKVFTQPCKKLWAIFLYVKPIYDLLLILKICQRLWSICFYVKLVYDLLLVLKVSIFYKQSFTLSRFEEKRFHPLCDY